MQVDFSLSEIVELVKPKSVRGATTERIRGLASLGQAQISDLSFMWNLKFRAEVGTTLASIVLLPADFAGEPKENQVFLLVDKPSVALAQVCSRIEQALWPKVPPGIHPSAVVDPSATVPASATIGPLCVLEAGAVIGERSYLQARVFVGRNARIGNDSWYMAGVTIATESVLGDRVRLQPGVVVGADGFGYEFMAGRFERLPQIGHVIVGNDVEIGANSTIDRARFSVTTIGEGTKIDNLVQIGHNCTIGRHCILCSQVGVSGSTTVEDYVVLGGQAGIAGHLTIGKGSKVDGQTGVNSDLDPGSFVKGTPCLPYNLEQRINVLRKKIPDLFKRVDALEERVGK